MHREEKIVAFTQFAATAEHYFRALRDRIRVCALDGRGARIASGRISRREALEAFAPVASGARRIRAIESIQLLIATDLLSEGVNLQDASVVVHLDLPWTAARMEQRVGRSRRLGAGHETTTVYAFTAPADAEMLLRQERRLYEKLQAAARLTGASGAILPLPRMGGAELALPSSPVRAMERVRARVAAWRAARQSDCDSACIVAFVRGATEGALALVRAEERHELVALLDTGISSSADHLDRATELVGGDDTPVMPEVQWRHIVQRILDWLTAQQAASIAGAMPSIATGTRRHAIRRIAQIASRIPRQHRASLSPLAAEARRIVTRSYGIGAERVLAELVGAVLPDDAWLRAVRAFGDANGGPAREPSEPAGSAPKLEAVIIFGP
jgi:hypothetical protein